MDARQDSAITSMTKATVLLREVARLTEARVGEFVVALTCKNLHP